MNVGQTSQIWGKMRRPLLGGAVLASLAVLVFGIWNVRGNLSEDDAAFVFYTVSRGDLPIVITERGSLEAQVETDIRCEVESLTRDTSGNYGTQIIFIVPNGSAVKESDLLVELDSTAIRERIDEETLDVQRAESARIQAVSRYDNQQLTNATSLAEAKLRLDLDELEREMYFDEDDGTHKLAREEVFRQVMAKRQALMLAETDLDGSQKLFDLGYLGKGDLDQAKFKRLQAEDGVASAVSQLQKLDKYEIRMQTKILDGAVASAERALKQVENDNTAKMAQVEAAKIEAESVETKEKERLQSLQEQLDKCQIYAPHDGMAVYAREGRSGSTEVGEGQMARQRQRLLSLPDLTKMQVKTEVHEAVLDKVRSGLPVTVRIDAFPDEVYAGTVGDVAVVPSSSSSSWFSTGVKTYETTVLIDGKVESLKPGMTAVVEIHVDRIKDILTVPVQAVVQRNRENWCYVGTSSGVERRDVELGRSNDKFVQIRDGVAEGERVVLNPMAILETQKEDGTDIGPDADATEPPEGAGQPASASDAAAKPAAAKGRGRPGTPAGPPQGTERPRGKSRFPGTGGPPGQKPSAKGRRQASAAAKPKAEQGGK